ncbi:hypothetical protein LPJ53_001575 [Coemansia erecta]|uniref:Chitin-binding type-2 domain-containing protein n=1 Tax=Coemansia erecta TaxID=147472 RepID=A0A9W7Y4L2_9FUNG|nr:hypothetical protein LPJ53_001575 [Coemansia erecta]
MHITSRLSLLALVALGPASAQTCSAGSYRCSAPSGQGTLFYQCDAGGTEVQKTCAPGTVCYSQGSTILCSYPVNTGAVQPASSSLTVGATCNFVSPYDEYMCPGANAQHDYYLRCLSGNYVSFPCPPGTACIKNEGQNMFCGWKGQAAVGSGEVAASSAVPPSMPPVEVSTGGSAGPPTGWSVESSTGSVELSVSVSIGGASSALFETSTAIGLPWDESTTASSSSTDSSSSETLLSSESALSSSSELSDSSSGSSDSSSSTHGLFSEEPPLFPTTSSGFLISMSIGVEESSSIGGSFEISSGVANASQTTEIAIGGTLSAGPATDIAASSASPSDIAVGSTISPAPTAHSGGSGLTGPMVSSGLSMLLNNGVQLPITLPNIDLPAIDLATVHLPDMTVDGINLAALPLPSITLPPFNPASLTKFSYIEELMSKAGVTFDDIAKLPLQELSNMDFAHLDVGALMSVVNVNRVSFPNNMVPTPLEEHAVAAQTPDPALQTTTLDADGIDALLGLSIMTYSTQ